MKRFHWSRQRVLRYIILPILLVLLFLFSSATLSILSGGSTGVEGVSDTVEANLVRRPFNKELASVVEEEGSGQHTSSVRSLRDGVGEGGAEIDTQKSSVSKFSSLSSSYAHHILEVDLKSIFGVGGEEVASADRFDAPPASFFSPSASGMCPFREDPHPPKSNVLYDDDDGANNDGIPISQSTKGERDKVHIKDAKVAQRSSGGEPQNGAGSSSDATASTKFPVDDGYEAANDEVELGDLYSSIHCIDGEVEGMPFVSPDDERMAGSADRRGDASSTNQYYSGMPSTWPKPPKGPFFGHSSVYGFDVVNRSCLFTNVLYTYPQQFTLFLPDTEHNRRLHREGLLVPPISLASRPYDGDGKKIRKIAKHSYNYRPNVVFGPVPGRADALLAVFQGILEKKAQHNRRAREGLGAAAAETSNGMLPDTLIRELIFKSASDDTEGLRSIMGFLSLYTDCEDSEESSKAAEEEEEEAMGKRHQKDELKFSALFSVARLREWYLDHLTSGKTELSASFLQTMNPDATSSTLDSQQRSFLRKSLRMKRTQYCEFVQSVAAHAPESQEKGGHSKSNRRVLSSSSSSSSSSLLWKKRPRPSASSRIPYDCAIIGYYTPIVAPWNYAHTLFCDLFGLFWGAYEFVFDGNGGDATRVSYQRWHWHVGGGVETVKSALRLLVDRVLPRRDEPQRGTARGEGGDDSLSEVGNDEVPRVWNMRKRKGDSLGGDIGGGGSKRSFLDLAKAFLGIEVKLERGQPSSVMQGHWSMVTSYVSPKNGLHTVSTVPRSSEPLRRRSLYLVRGRERRHTPLLFGLGGTTSEGVFNGNELLYGGGARKGNNSSSSLSSSSSAFSGMAMDPSGSDGSPAHAVASFLDDSIPRPDLKVVATSNHYANSFELPNKNKAFEMFSRYRTASSGDRGGSAPTEANKGGGAVYDRSLRNNTLYRGLLAGIGTKSWSWVTDAYAASGNGHVWYAFRQHMYDVTGAMVSGGPPLSAAADMPSRDEVQQSRVKKETVDSQGDGGPVVAADDVAEKKKKPEGAKSSESDPFPLHRPLRISICHKKDKRGVVNYEETLHFLEEHFAPLVSLQQQEVSSSSFEFKMDFVLEAAVGRSAAKQVEMMDKADIFMCNEGTLATSMFLLGPGSVFISLPLVYHMANLHRMKMPDVEQWWREPDLLRPDPRKNTGGNIDWFPQSIPWVRTFWYDSVPLSETKIQTPLKGLRNYMPEWNIVVQGAKVARLYEKVLGYLLSQSHPKVAGLAEMIARVNQRERMKGSVEGHDLAFADDKRVLVTEGDDGLARNVSTNHAVRRLGLLKRIDFWRRVFDYRKKEIRVKNIHQQRRLLGPNEEEKRAAVVKAELYKAQVGNSDHTANGYYYLKPQHPTVSERAVTALSLLREGEGGHAPATPSSIPPNGGINLDHDSDHSYSVNARLCRGILSVSPKWSVAFNGVKCLYGMSWLCEFWSNTRLKSRGLHPKWARSKGRCGDAMTTVEGANAFLMEKASSSSSSSSSSIERGGSLLADPRTTVSPSYLALASSVLRNMSHKGRGSQLQTSSQLLESVAESPDDFCSNDRSGRSTPLCEGIVQLAASSPFLFSSSLDHPRALEAFLFYDPQRVRSTFGTTDINLEPIGADELESVFGAKRMQGGD